MITKKHLLAMRDARSFETLIKDPSMLESSPDDGQLVVRTTSSPLTKSEKSQKPLEQK